MFYSCRLSFQIFKKIVLWLYHHNISLVIIPVLLINNQWKFICNRCWRLLSAVFSSSQYKLTSSLLKIWTNMTISFLCCHRVVMINIYKRQTSKSNYANYAVQNFYMHYNTFTTYIIYVTLSVTVRFVHVLDYFVHHSG